MNLNFIYALLLLLLINVQFTSCCEDVMDSNTSVNNFIGDWNLNENISKHKGDTLIQSNTVLKTIRINKNGEVIIYNDIIGNDTINWLYQSQPELIFIGEYDPHILDNNYFVFELVENNPTKQIWKASRFTIEFSTGDLLTELIQWDLTK